MDCTLDKFQPTLQLDPVHYQKCFQTFSRYMQFDEPYEPWYNRVLGVALRDKLGGSPAVTLANGQPLRHLGVGSGSGELEKQILLPLLKEFKHIFNQVIEPSEQQINIYQASLDEDHEIAAAVEFDWRQETLEEYRANSSARTTETDQEKFHLITAVHSIYYGSSMEEKVPWLLNLLADGGVMAFVLISETDSLCKVQRRIFSPDIPGYRYYSRQKLQSFLDRNNIHYETIDLPRCVIDVTPCFDADSEEGARVLDFLSHVKHFRTDVSKDQGEHFLSLLRKNVHTVRGRLMVTHDTSTVIVQRRANQIFISSKNE